MKNEWVGLKDKSWMERRMYLTIVKIPRNLTLFCPKPFYLSTNHTFIRRILNTNTIKTTKRKKGELNKIKFNK